MVRVSTFMYSEDTISDPTPQGPRLNVVNPQLVFRPMFLPSLFSFAITFGISGIDNSQEHKFKFLFFAPNDVELLINSEFMLPINTEEKAELPLEERGVMMNMNLRNVPFKVEGVYNSELIVDGVSLGKFSIYVKGKEQG